MNNKVAVGRKKIQEREVKRVGILLRAEAAVATLGNAYNTLYNTIHVVQTFF